MFNYKAKLELDKLQKEAQEVIDKKNTIIDEYKNVLFFLIQICSLMEARENDMKNRVRDLSSLLRVFCLFYRN